MEMPGNIVKINSSEELAWYVGDSKMEELIKFLNEIGVGKTSEEEKK